MNGKKIFALCFTIPCVLLSLVYIVLIIPSYLGIQLPVLVDENVLFADWVFMAIPVLALVSSILLQVASVRKKRKRKHKETGR